MNEYNGIDFYCDVAIPKKIPLDIVFESENILAYHHTKPHWKVHVVVTPKRHVDSLLTLKEKDLAAELLECVQNIASTITSKHGACRVITNLGEYQDSKHLHIHLCYGDK